MPPPNPGILTGAEGCWDADDRNSGFFPCGAVTKLVASFFIFRCLLDHGFQVFERLDVVCQSVDNDFGSVCQTTPAEGDEVVSFLLTHVVDDGDEVVPGGVRADTAPRDCGRGLLRGSSHDRFAWKERLRRGCKLWKLSMSR